MTKLIILVTKKQITVTLNQEPFINDKKSFKNNKKSVSKVIDLIKKHLKKYGADNTIVDIKSEKHGLQTIPAKNVLDEISKILSDY